jgi:RNA recognition motif-containing protein
MGELGIDGNPVITTGDASQQDYPRSYKESEFVTPSRQLFIGNILSSVTEEMLVQLFSRFGELETIKSFTNRGYAFVVYKDVRVVCVDALRAPSLSLSWL